MSELSISYLAGQKSKPPPASPPDVLYKITVGLRPDVITVAQLATPFSYPFVLITVYCDEPSAKAWVADVQGQTVCIKSKVGSNAQQVSATLLVRVSDGTGARRIPS